MITIYFTDNSLTFAPEDYTPKAGETLLTESEVTSANLDNLFDFCNSIVVLSADWNAAFHRFASRFVAVEAAGGIVENELGEMLLIYRRERWDLPKGHIDAGEDALSAAIREIAEETGVVGLNFVAQIGNTLHAYNVYGKWELKLTHWFAFSCHSSSTTPQTDEDIVLAVWADREKRIECMTNSYPTIREIVYEYEHRR
ncbi:MAG: NUDIX domain-containing protein [Alistipes sp.]|nr:NUDIX domain-containing protein [Alistipes sp.]